MVRSDSISFPWFAPAGTQRGLVDNATSLGYVNSSTGEFVGFTLTNGFRDLLYDNKINPITYLPGAGITVYGQKTRSAATTAFDRINVSRLVSYIRNRVALLSRPFIFEPNDKITRDQLKQITEQMLNDLSAKRALYDFLVVCDTTNNTPARIDRNELYMDIAIEPVKAVEFIYIPLRIKSTGSITSNF
jgi:phage tail sheath protein FI